MCPLKIKLKFVYPYNGTYYYTHYAERIKGIIALLKSMYYP